MHFNAGVFPDSWVLKMPFNALHLIIMMAIITVVFCILDILRSRIEIGPFMPEES
ncbi:MAG: hypothetical protein ACP5R0_00635 [Thermoplasmata archaeon]